MVTTLYHKLIHRKREIKELTDLGVVSATVMRDIEIFEEFEAMEQHNVCVICRYELLAYKYKFKDWSSVQKIVSRMKSRVE